jgi:succinate dehydrogenase / fumarate reductase, flavoprotein subunit
VKAGRGSPHGGVLLDIASRRDADFIKRRLPSMYHQFKELADVDITKEPMEVGPTCHYMMGGVRNDADTTATRVPGLFVAGEIASGLHGANRLGGNSLSDLVVFGRRAGQYAAEYALGLGDLPAADHATIGAVMRDLLVPFDDNGDENPYTIHHDLQECMQHNVGIIRTAGELDAAIIELEKLKARLRKVRIEGNRHFNPGWHLALDLRAMLLVSEAVTLGAIERKESRGGHTREDFPKTDAKLAKVNVVIERVDRELRVRHEPLPEMPPELKALFEEK